MIVFLFLSSPSFPLLSFPSSSTLKEERTDVHVEREWGGNEEKKEGEEDEDEGVSIQGASALLYDEHQMIMLELIKSDCEKRPTAPPPANGTVFIEGS